MQDRSRPPRAALALGAVPTAPACARAWTREILQEWGLDGLSDASELIVSELATNAVLASRREGAPFFWLVLTLDDDGLAILVRDFCAGTRQARNPSGEDEDGRGLQLVEAMSDRAGWYPVRDGTPGKVVYAVLASLSGNLVHHAGDGETPGRAGTGRAGARQALCPGAATAPPTARCPARREFPAARKLAWPGGSMAGPPGSENERKSVQASRVASDPARIVAAVRL